MKIKSGTSEQKTWAQANGARAAKMFKAGKSISEIAEVFGDRGKQNRVRSALNALGLYEFKHRKAVKKAPHR